MAGFLQDLLRMCLVLKGRECTPVYMGLPGAAEPAWGAAQGKFGQYARATILYNPILAADLPSV